MTRRLATILIVGQILIDLGLVIYIWIDTIWRSKMTAIVDGLTRLN